MPALIMLVGASASRRLLYESLHSAGGVDGYHTEQ